LRDGYLFTYKDMGGLPPGTIDLAPSGMAGGARRLARLARRHRARLLSLGHRGHMYGHEGFIDEVRQAYRLPAEVVVVPVGGTPSFALALAAFCVGTGDRRVLVETPGYPPFADAARGLGLAVDPLVRNPAAGFSVDGAAVRAAWRGGCGMCVVSSPMNPTGAELAHDVMREIADALAEASRPAGIAATPLIVDETFLPPPDPTAPSAVSLARNVVVINSLSKTFGLGPLRAGFIAAWPPYGEALRRAWVHFFNVGSSLTDSLAALAMRFRAGFADDFARVTDENRATLRAVVARSGGRLRCAVPPRGLTAWIDVPDTDPDALARDLVTTAGVRVLSGRLFGLNGGMRVGLGLRPAAFRAGLGRVADFVNSPAGS
jgi:aspartate/methionine/tyrosine aminotransferase